MSATDLVKASAMYFHIVNEKFGQQNPALKDEVNNFLQNVWNEAAVVTNRKDIDSINEIAGIIWEVISPQEQALQSSSQTAQFLYDSGLRLANPKRRSFSRI